MVIAQVSHRAQYGMNDPDNDNQLRPQRHALAVAQNMRASTGVLALAVVLASARLAAGAVETGFLDRAVTVAGGTYRYQVYVPAAYSTAEAWPVILFLHGSGECGSDGLAPTVIGIGPAIRRLPARYPAIVVFPQAPADSSWAGMPGEMALAALDRTLAEFHADSTRVYLVGLSMGGNGAWHLAYRHPERFAALAVICGYVTPPATLPNRESAVPAEDGEPLVALARRLGRLPIWIFHGEVDSVVPVDASRRAAQALERAGGDVRYSEFLGVDHGVWDAVFSSPSFTEWLLAQRRQP
jgi:predicted peptidase